jgi:hypothetical protein
MKKNSTYCPIFASSNIWDQLNKNFLEKDHLGLFRPLEMIVLPGEKMITSVIDRNIMKVLCPDLGHSQPFFALSRFFGSPLQSFDRDEDSEKKSIIAQLQSYLGLPYVWGGNWVLKPSDQKLIEDLFFDHSHRFIKNLSYLFSGLDCSGLLYAASKGKVPRNTSELIKFGQSLPIDRLDNRQILELVLPLDILVWKGHVLIFLEKNKLIESRHGYGVVTSIAHERLDEIRQTKTPSSLIKEDSFVINRWLQS